MKKTLFTLLISYSLSCSAQDMFSATSGKVHFFSDTPMEKIDGVNLKSKSLLNTTTKKIAVVIPIIEFKFESPLLEEHFNENYMETDKFKTANFQGVINENVDLTKDGTYKVTATGKFTVHGVEKDRTFEGTIDVKSGKITLDSKFKVALKDHNIAIPTVVALKIAETVDADVHFEYELKK